MIKKEYLDAYDREEQRLGYKILRGSVIPKGVYHMVVEVITVTKTGKILMTKRHPNKHFPLHLEFTGGSVLAGEEPEEAAKRELFEETGLVPKETLLFLGTIVSRDVIYKDYLNVMDEEKEIRLQEGETIDFRYFSLESFAEVIANYECVPSCIKKFKKFENKILKEIV